ncbi:GNAT family N-acetyltransferase [Paenibacillus gorillae]|uniref:GNAT family N-acetyltransferase n=1 Tax=Paenibacillus gorillae TaxID=1243662 RepID=UPI0004B298FA|nr:GNAT family protein [Paenibacillus gorillae]
MSNFDMIITDRLFIRILDMRDRDAFFSYRTMPEVYKYQSWKPENRDDAENFLTANMAVVPNTSDSWLQLAVCLKDGSLAGDVGIHFLEDGFQAEIGYTFSPEYQRKGYAAEAVSAVMDYLFIQLNKHRITGSVDPDNLRSIKLLEGLGFRKEAHFVKSYRMNDQWYDDCVYAMLADEWK